MFRKPVMNIFLNIENEPYTREQKAFITLYFDQRYKWNIKPVSIEKDMDIILK